MTKTAKLILENGTFEFPVIEGTEQEKAVDISKLRAQTGYVTLDNGYMNTGACTSNITFLDGEKGILKYRGIPIEVLAEKSTFMEVAYLLINGKLPNEKQFLEFRNGINDVSKVPDGIINIIKQFPKDAHPMGVLSAAMVGLSAFYPEYLDADLTPEKKVKVINQLIAQMRIICAAFYRHSIGKNPVKSDTKLSYCADFMHLMFDKGNIDPAVAQALDILLILHADHEQNCSSTTVRVVGSSQANPFASISAGIDALWGPLHGGANQAVLEMLEAIHQDGGDFKKFLARAKDKNDTFRLMGFGHRVYKNFDPRAKIIKKACDTVLDKLGVDDPLLEIAKGLEAEALKDPYFVERKLYPNVDFYSGIIYRALGIPTNMFTVMFALGRLPGWLAQWKELIESDAMKIARPRQIYTGDVNSEYVDIKKRK
ncbi:MAG: citrate synthase [Bacteriovoracaceae bacterium]|nr:citrate synthase [Bacteriovoracaceae bacterium]